MTGWLREDTSMEPKVCLLTLTQVPEESKRRNQKEAYGAKRRVGGPNEE
jgi:hypothetical protein